MSISPLSPQTDAQQWQRRVNREALHQGRIELAFDRVDALARLGDYAGALAWLAQAEELSGDLPPTYAARRARWMRLPGRVR